MQAEAPPLSEAMAGQAFARAWNRLDPQRFIDLLDAQARHSLPWEADELVGRDAIARLLLGRMGQARAYALNSPERTVFAELGKTVACAEGHNHEGARDCVVLAQGRAKSVTAAVVFEVGNGRIQRFDLCVLERQTVARSGVYPI